MVAFDSTVFSGQTVPGAMFKTTLASRSRAVIVTPFRARSLWRSYRRTPLFPSGLLFNHFVKPIILKTDEVNAASQGSPYSCAVRSASVPTSASTNSQICSRTAVSWPCFA